MGSRITAHQRGEQKQTNKKRPRGRLTLRLPKLGKLFENTVDNGVHKRLLPERIVDIAGEILGIRLTTVVSEDCLDHVVPSREEVIELMCRRALHHRHRGKERCQAGREQLHGVNIIRREPQ